MCKVWSPVCEGLMRRMHVAMRDGGGHSLLWRFGGHPKVPTPLETIDVLDAIVVAAARLDVPWGMLRMCEDVHEAWAQLSPVFGSAAAERKRELVDAAATLRALPEESAPPFRATFRALLSKGTGEADGGEADRDPKMRDSARVFEASLAPLCDLFCLHSEYSALATLWAQLLSRHPADSAAPPSLLKAAASVAMLGSTQQASKSIASQHWQWLSDRHEASTDGDEGKVQGTGGGEGKVQGTGGDIGVLMEMQVQWYGALWQSSANHHAVFCHLPVILRHNARLPSHATLPLVPSTSAGPPTLFGPMQAAVGAELLSDNHTVALRDVPRRLAQIRSLSAHLASVELKPPSLDPMIAQLVGHLRHIVAAYSSTFEHDRHATLVETVRRVVAYCEAPADGVPPRVDEIVAVASESSDAQLCSLAAPVAGPLCETLCNAATSLARGGDGALALVGRASAMLGLLRLHLLLPRGPLDPTVKTASKLDSADKRIAATESEVAIRSVAEQWFTGGETTPAIDELQRHTAWLSQRRGALKRKVVERPSPSQYPAIYAAAKRFGETLGSVGRVVELLDSVAGASLVQQEQLWQDNALELVHRLERFTHYVDIVTPLSLAVHEIKFGLRLATHAALGKKGIPVGVSRP